MTPFTAPPMVPMIDHHDPAYWPNLLIAPYLCPDYVVIVAMSFLLAAWELRRRARATGEIVLAIVAKTPAIAFAVLAVAGIVASTLLVCFAPRYLAQSLPLVYLLLGFGLFGNGQRQRWKYAVLFSIVAVNLTNQYGQLFPSLADGPGIRHSEPEKAYERSHEYERFQDATIHAVRWLESNAPHAELLVTGPFGHILGDPRFGYVQTPLNVACVGMKQNVFPHVRGPEEVAFHDPVYVRDRYANRSILAAIEPGDEILFDDGRSPPLQIFRKRWQTTLPSNAEAVEPWLDARGWMGASVVDRIRHRLAALRWAGREQQASDELDHFVKTFPESFELRAMWISTVIAAGEAADAEALLRQARVDFPTVAWFPASLARLLLAQNRSQEAVEPIETSLRLAPDTPEILAILAELRDRQGRWKEAEAIYRSLADQSDDPALLRQFGDLLLREGNPSDALVYLNKAASRSPDDVQIQRLAVRALMTLGRPMEAVPRLQKVLHANPTDPESLLALGFALQQAGETKEAVSILRKLSSTRPEARNLLAWILATDPNPAIRNGAEALTLALELQKDQGDQAPEVLDTLAAAYAEVGRFEEAAATQDRFLRLIARTATDERLREVRRRLDLYRTRQAYRQPP